MSRAQAGPPILWDPGASDPLDDLTCELMEDDEALTYAQARKLAGAMLAGQEDDAAYERYEDRKCDRECP